MRAVIYARYSSDLQSATSIDDQVRVCRERIDREGWKLQRIYADRASSGASPLRAEYQRMLEDARRRQFDVVIAEALDRLSRDQEHVAHLYKALSFASVRVVTLSEGEISELHIGLSGTMGALYLKQLAEKTRRGLRGRIEAGRSAGGNCYGYKVVMDAASKGRRTIEEQEAMVVRRVFTLYRDGVSPREIAKTLNAEGVRGPSGGTWGPSTINGNRRRGTGLLNNELYIGRLVWDRLRYVKDPTTGKRRSQVNSRNSLTTTDVPHLRIVPQALWDSVKARQLGMARTTPVRSREAFWEYQRPKHLLSGLMKCGQCGASFTKSGLNRFSCAATKDRGTCTNKLTVHGREVEEAILHGLKTRLMQPDLFEEFAREFVKESNRHRSEIAAAKLAEKSQIAVINRQIDHLVNAIAAGADAMSLNAKLKELEAARAMLLASSQDAEDGKPLLHPSLAHLYRAKVEGISAALGKGDEGKAAFAIIRSLIQEVRLVPDGNGLAIELAGDLAGILAVAEGRPSEPSAGSKALQIKMVAGARNSFGSHGRLCGFRLEKIKNFGSSRRWVAGQNRV